MRVGKLVIYIATLLAILFLTTAECFPFTQKSGVTELTPETFTDFLQTHKPVVILFYAPWCGHCKNFHAEYERFAASVKGTIRVGAVNADTHRSLGQKFGVQGFPTIKYWGPGNKLSPSDYNGQRTAAALQRTMLDQVTSKHIKKVNTLDEVKQLAHSVPSKKLAILFSTKSKVPGMFSIAALSPKLKNLAFVFVGTIAEENVGEYNLTTLPSISYVEGVEGGEVKMEQMSGKSFTYESIASFFLGKVEGLETIPENTGSQKMAGDEKDDGVIKEKVKAKMALPLKPETFTNATLKDFCNPQSLKVKGTIPFCVINLNKAIDLSALHATFQQDAVLFFDASSEHETLKKSLEEHFQFTKSEQEELLKGSTILVFRQTKNDVIRFKSNADQSKDSEISSFLQHVFYGEIRMDSKKL